MALSRLYNIVESRRDFWACVRTTLFNSRRYFQLKVSVCWWYSSPGCAAGITIPSSHGLSTTWVDPSRNTSPGACVARRGTRIHVNGTDAYTTSQTDTSGAQIPQRTTTVRGPAIMQRLTGSWPQTWRSQMWRYIPARHGNSGSMFWLFYGLAPYYLASVLSIVFLWEARSFTRFTRNQLHIIFQMKTKILYFNA